MKRESVRVEGYTTETKNTLEVWTADQMTQKQISDIKDENNENHSIITAK